MLKLVLKQDEPQTIELKTPRMTLGRDPSNDVVLDEEGVSGFHAEIQQEGDQLFIVDLGSANGTLLNGKRVSGKQALKPWDRLQIDTIEMELVDPDARRPTKLRPAIRIDDAASPVDPGATTVRPAVSGWWLEGMSGAFEGKRIPVQGKLLVGREAPADLLIEQSEISRRHAELELRDGKLLLRDLGSANGTRVGDQRVESAELKSGDIVYFDEMGFKVHGPEHANKTRVRPAVPPTVATPAQVERLSAVEGDVAGEHYPLTQDRMTLGRDADCDLVIDDPTVSGRHARLERHGGQVTIHNLSQTNGLRLNGQPVEESPLQPGDRIQMGKVVLRFEVPGKTPARTQVMPAADTPTRTLQQPAVLKRLPTWSYGVISFLLVAAVFLAVTEWTGGPERIEGKLQGGRVWQQTLSAGRSRPATPALADVNGDRYLDVIVPDASGFVLALDGAEGKKIFESEVPGKVIAAAVTGDMTGDGVADAVIASHAGVVTTLNGKGQVIWRSQEDLNLGTLVNRPVLKELNGDDYPEVIVPTSNRGLVALDGGRGWEVWNTAEITRGKLVSVPLIVDVDDDGEADFVTLSDQGQLMALSARRGKIWQLWEARLPPVLYASPVYLPFDDAQGLIVCATRDSVVAVQASSGRIAWQRPMNARFFASPVVTDGNADGLPDVAVITLKGVIHVLDGQTGDEIWSAELNSGVKATPAVFDVNYDDMGDLVILTESGQLIVMDMARGRPLLSVSLSSAGFVASPVLGDLTNDGMLEIVAADTQGRIQAFALNRALERGQAYWPGFLGTEAQRGAQP